MSLQSTTSAVCLGLSLAFLSGGCGDEGSSEQASGSEASIYTTFYPTTYFTERILGEIEIPVLCPLPEDADPIHWHPDREQIQAYQQASLIIVNGAGFEQWLEQASLPTSRIVDTAKGFREQFLRYEAVTHSHGMGGEHTHAGLDGHTWLDPILAKAQAGAIAEALRERFPEHAEALRSGLAALEADLDSLDARYKAWSEQLADTPLLASHPAYNYLAKRYDWKLSNLDLDPSNPLSEDEMATLRSHVQHGHKILLWESAPIDATRNSAQELGLRNVVVSPCEQLSTSARASGTDYLSVQRNNLNRLEQVLD